MTAPIAKKQKHVKTVHGVELKDNYHWLRDDNWPQVKDDSVISYLRHENDYNEEFFSNYSQAQEKIFEELKGRIKLSDKSLPIQRDNYLYYTRTEEDKNYPIFCRCKIDREDREEIILDQNKLAAGKKFLDLGDISVSPGHELLAYSVDDEGDERFAIYIKNLATGEHFEEVIYNTIDNIVWHESKNGFFYSVPNEHWRPDTIMYHKIGTSAMRDNMIFREEDQRFRVSLDKTSSKRFILIENNSFDSTENYFIDINDESMHPNLVVPRRDNHIYEIDHNGDYFYILTNDKGKNFRIARTPVGNYSEPNWRDYIPHDSKRYLTGFDLTQDFLILNYSSNALPEIKVVRLEDNLVKAINFEEEAFVANGYSTNYELNDIRISYSSLSRPDSTYEYHFNDEGLKLLKQREIPSGHDPSKYQVKRLYAPSEGGEEVPISLIYNKQLFRGDGSDSLFLFAYGSYGAGMEPSFSSNIFTMIDRGFVFAIAHVRGGDEKGYQWYEDGKFLKKKNTFLDFLNCAEYLIEHKYTSQQNIVTLSGSAGGMLIGYVLNERPELFRAAVAKVPFVDVLNTMLDDSLPLTPGEFKEWGNPQDKEYFHYIKSYSPYDNVKKQNYPHLYVTASINDQRVTYWEPAKWVAKLRDYKTDNNYLLLETNMSAGHSGSSGRFDYLKEIAREYLFLLVTTGKDI
jgi:oligopeptidase B